MVSNRKSIKHFSYYLIDWWPLSTFKSDSFSILKQQTFLIQNVLKINIRSHRVAPIIYVKNAFTIHSITINNVAKLCKWHDFLHDWVKRRAIRSSNFTLYERKTVLTFEFGKLENVPLSSFCNWKTFDVLVPRRKNHVCFSLCGLYFKVYFWVQVFYFYYSVKNKRNKCIPHTNFKCNLQF